MIANIDEAKDNKITAKFSNKFLLKMCRWIAYVGEPIFMDTIITKPSASLVEQSLNSRMAFKHDGSILSTNGDGFGVGWYSDKTNPGLFKGAEPAWANENLNEICAQVKAHIFMAHVRAASSGSVQRSNAHPFKYKNWLFQHNGFIGNFDLIKRELHASLSDELYNAIKGTTDSETLFKLMLEFGLQDDAKKAVEKTISYLLKIFDKKGVKPELALSCAISDGAAIYTIRFATIERPSTQFYSIKSDCLKDIDDKNSFILPQKSAIIVSEPLTHYNEFWQEMPLGSFAVIREGEVEIMKLEI